MARLTHPTRTKSNDAQPSLGSSATNNAQPSLGSSARGRINVAFALFWVALAVALYFGMDALIKPRVANVTIATDSGSEIVIPRSRNGHYYVAGTINGHPTTFMVDTGASTIAIDPKIARAANLPKGLPSTFNTASGSAEGEIVPNQKASVGDFDFANLRIAVIEGVGEYGLLGQNVLRHLEVIQAGDQMILRAKKRTEAEQ